MCVRLMTMAAQPAEALRGFRPLRATEAAQAAMSSLLLESARESMGQGARDQRQRWQEHGPCEDMTICRRVNLHDLG